MNKYEALFDPSSEHQKRAKAFLEEVKKLPQERAIPSSVAVEIEDLTEKDLALSEYMSDQERLVDAIFSDQRALKPLEERRSISDQADRDSAAFWKVMVSLSVGSTRHRRDLRMSDTFISMLATARGAHRLNPPKIIEIENGSLSMCNCYIFVANLDSEIPED